MYTGETFLDIYSNISTSNCSPEFKRHKLRSRQSIFVLQISSNLVHPFERVVRTKIQKITNFLLYNECDKY